MHIVTYYISNITYGALELTWWWTERKVPTGTHSHQPSRLIRLLITKSLFVQKVFLFLYLYPGIQFGSNIKLWNTNSTLHWTHRIICRSLILCSKLLCRPDYKPFRRIVGHLMCGTNIKLIYIYFFTLFVVTILCYVICKFLLILIAY